ncbi:MAG: hypothetical protein H0U74_02820, partial [Bradymonadaceae bacterium]|nr:hypothetical protein [Lujinxingiaceae bacterium]
MPIARRIFLGSLLLLVALAGCDCEQRVRKLAKPSDEKRVAARTEFAQIDQLSEVEPNDGPRQATPIVIRNELRPVHAEIDSAQDIDWFSVTSEGEERVMVELSVEPSDAALNVAIYLEVPGALDVEPLLYDVARAGEIESIPILLIGPEPLRFFVAGVGGTVGKYTIQFRRRLSGGAIEAEPNDFAHTPTALTIPGEIQGFYDRPRDRDIYHVGADQLKGEVYSLEITSIEGLTQSVNVYADARLEQPLLSLSVTSRGPASIPNFALPAEAQGLWFVLSAGEGYDRQRGYRLKILEHPAETEFTLEREPNDTEANPQPVVLGEVLRGYLHDPTDVDRFRLTLEAAPASE